MQTGLTNEPVVTLEGKCLTKAVMNHSSKREKEKN